MKLVVIATIVLFASIALADGENLIYDADINAPGNYETTDGQTFDITLIGDEIALTLGSTSLIVDNGSCEINGLVKVCLIIEKFSHYDIHGPERIVNYRKVSIYTFPANIIINRTFTRTKFWTEQEAEVSVRIQNIGESQTPINYIDNYSNSFEVRGISGCTIKHNVALLNSTLKQNQLSECNYRIRAIMPIKFSSVAKVTYFTPFETSLLDTQLLTVLNPALIMSAQDVAMDLKDKTDFNISINVAEPIQINSLKIIFPPGISPGDWDSRLKLSEDRVLLFSGPLTPKDNTTFTISLVPVRTGNQIIRLEADYNILENNVAIPQILRSSHIVNITYEELYARLPTDNVTNSLKILAINPTALDVFNLSMVVSTDLPLKNNDNRFDVVTLLGHREMQAEIGPASPGNYSVNITLQYYTAQGELLTVLQQGIINLGKQPEKKVEAEKLSDPPKSPGVQPITPFIPLEYRNNQIWIIGIGGVIAALGVLIFVFMKAKK